MKKHYKDFRKLQFVQELKREGAQELWDDLHKYYDVVMVRIGNLLLAHGINLEEENRVLDRILKEYNVTK